MVGGVTFEVCYFINLLLVPLKSAELDVFQQASAILSRGALNFGLKPVELCEVLFDLLQNGIDLSGLALESRQLLLGLSSRRAVNI